MHIRLAILSLEQGLSVGIARDGLQQHFQGFVAGFEYTLYGLFGTSADVGLLGEYHFDSRWDDALTAFNHDVFTGTRITLNDTQDTTLLGGVFFDHENHSTSARVEFERRFGSHFTLELQGQWFASSDADEISYAFRRDSFLSVALRRYF